ncbi:MAG: hypothetical protein GY870_13620, partial [archaeon]|nr:hypothetical protein [archaeon]
SKCGGPAIDGVDKGIAEIVMKSGTIGIRIKIMPLSYKMPDEIILKDPELKKKMDEINKKRKKVLDDTVEDANILIDKETSQILIDKEEIEESIFDEVEGEAEIEEIEIEDLEKEEKGEKKKKKSKKEKSTKEKSPKKKKEKEAEDKEEVIDEATETKEDKKKVKKAKKKKEKEEKNSD